MDRSVARIFYPNAARCHSTQRKRNHTQLASAKLPRIREIFVRFALLCIGAEFQRPALGSQMLCLHGGSYGSSRLLEKAPAIQSWLVFHPRSLSPATPGNCASPAFY